jgi:DNA-3-methyladenine glycosylase II
MFNKAIQHLTQHDPALASIIASSSLPTFHPHTHYYQALVESIIGQQLSVSAAHAIRERFKALSKNGFPTPEEIIDYTVEELRGIGLSRPKAAYIQDLAKHVIDRTIQLETFDTFSNEKIISELTAVKGIGEWTAHMFLIFCMGRLDVLPAGDLGIRNGIAKLYDVGHVPSPLEVAAIADRHQWHPYESVASWYIWRSLGNTPTVT